MRWASPRHAAAAGCKGRREPRPPTRLGLRADAEAQLGSEETPQDAPEEAGHCALDRPNVAAGSSSHSDRGGTGAQTLTQLGVWWLGATNCVGSRGSAHSRPQLLNWF